MARRVVKLAVKDEETIVVVVQSEGAKNLKWCKRFWRRDDFLPPKDDCAFCLLELSDDAIDTVHTDSQGSIVRIALEHNQIHTIETLPANEVGTAWYTLDEFNANRRQRNDTKKQVIQDEIEIRRTPGMKTISNEVMSKQVNRHNMTRRRAIDAVRKEQKRQSVEGIHDEELLATIYQGYNITSVRNALKQARHDMYMVDEEWAPLTPPSQVFLWYFHCYFTKMTQPTLSFVNTIFKFFLSPHFQTKSYQIFCTQNVL